MRRQHRLVNHLSLGPLALATIVALAAGLAACDDDDDEATLEIISPAAGERIEVGDDLRVDLDLWVRGFDVREIGECLEDSDDDDPCGQIILRVDGDACNRPGLDYNAISDEEDIAADLSFCPEGERLGPHTLTVELRQEGGRAADLDLAPVQASVTILAE